jgi:hypothetical protein
MPQGDGFGRQITVQWGAAVIGAVIGGVFLLAAGLLGGREWKARSQASPSFSSDQEVADSPSANGNSQVLDLQRRIHNLERQSEGDQAVIKDLREKLATKDLDLQRLRSGSEASSPIPNPPPSYLPPKKVIAT